MLSLHVCTVEYASKNNQTHSSQCTYTVGTAFLRKVILWWHTSSNTSVIATRTHKQIPFTVTRIILGSCNLLISHVKDINVFPFTYSLI